jgi:hypothetical protein
MDRLSLETFIAAAEDPELSQYKVLAALKLYSEMLRKNKLYPTFGELAELKNSINELQKQRVILDELTRSEVRALDFDENGPVFEENEETDDKMNAVFKFIDWATPQIETLISEGKAIFDFMETNTQISELGIIPLYNKEGYFLIDDNIRNEINVFRYEMFLVGPEDDPLTTLKSRFLYKIYNDTDYRLAPDVIKLSLIERYPDLPNPALYRIKNDIGFPFHETVLPVAKRKLMQFLAE